MIWREQPESVLVLEHDAVVRDYLARTAAALERARLSEHYPPARTLAAQLRAMSPEVHLGLHPRLHVDVRTGLPTYREWTRVHTDAEMSAQVLAELPPRETLEARAAAAPATIWAKQLVKHHYHTALTDLLADSPPTARMQVALRRVEPAERRAWFHVVLDKLDASGVYVRFAIDLSQQASRWRKPMLELDEASARETEGFRSMIYRLTGLDAEFTFVRLAATEGLAVERVIKGTIGPFFMPGTNHPRALAPLFEGCDATSPGTGPLVATFGLDMAATDVARDGDNDPLEDLLTEQLSEAGRAGYAQARAQHGYHVFKDRKLVVSSHELVAPVEAFCAGLGARNVIYVLRGA